MCVCVRVRACVRAFVYVCVRACVRACVCASGSVFISMSLAWSMCLQAESMHMQNIDHLLWTFSKLNEKTVAGEVDIGRIRHWALNNLSTCMRQTICLSAFPTPQLINLFHKFCCNAAGRVRFTLKNTTAVLH